MKFKLRSSRKRTLEDYAYSLVVGMGVVFALSSIFASPTIVVVGCVVLLTGSFL